MRRGCTSILLNRFQRCVGDAELARERGDLSRALDDCVEERGRPLIVASWSESDMRRCESFGSRISMNLDGVSRMVNIRKHGLTDPRGIEAPGSNECGREWTGRSQEREEGRIPSWLLYIERTKSRVCSDETKDVAGSAGCARLEEDIPTRRGPEGFMAGGGTGFPKEKLIQCDWRLLPNRNLKTKWGDREIGQSGMDWTFDEWRCRSGEWS